MVSSKSSKISKRNNGLLATQKIPVKSGLNGLKASYAPGCVSEQDKLFAVKTTKMKSSKAKFVT